MKRIYSAITIGAIVSLPAAAQVDVAGKWEMTFEGPRGSITQILTLEQDGNTVTGTAEMSGGGRAAARRQGAGNGRRGVRRPTSVAITDGAIDGTIITFSMVRTMGDRTMTTSYTGTIDGDSITGTMTTPRGESAFTAVRAATD